MRPLVGNYEQALAVEIQRLREALRLIAATPGQDVERLKRIAREALEHPG